MLASQREFFLQKPEEQNIWKMVQNQKHFHTRKLPRVPNRHTDKYESKKLTTVSLATRQIEQKIAT